ncbi:hypothetical protein LTS18_000029 [Coniosporium uncinatum]|uniref:Uncharacterized protein n=1 Tax=Coniosporium uncinatum TaxID=93489 RepID=A0ACC3DDM8_9PEZI|nr:hypothetical protein LTS18_000029 [Coniosporium uncinatum]
MSNQNYYNPPPGPPPGQQQQQQQYAPPGPHQQQHPQGHQTPHRTNTDAFLPQGQERSEQTETMQAYEAAALQNEDDKNQEQLQKEFPNIDSSLIAAIYADTKDVGQTREMMQHLSSEQK